MNLSTSNSKYKWLMRGMVWALLFLVLSEVLIFRNPSFYGLVPNSFIGQIGNVKNRLHQQDRTKIKLLILGDSQSLHGLLPQMLAEKYGLQPDEIFNLSLNAGKAIDMLHIFEEEAKGLPNLQAVWICVNEHQFNSVNYLSDNKFRFFASFAERWDEPSFSNRMELLFGGLFYSYGLREVWTSMYDMYQKGEIPQEPIDHYAYRWGLPTNFITEPTHFGATYSKDVINRWMENFRFPGAQTRALDLLLQKIKKRNLSFSIIQLPRTQTFESIMKETYPNQQQEYRNYLDQLGKKYKGRWMIIPPSLNDSYFFDANHLNPDGARKILPLLPDHYK